MTITIHHDGDGTTVTGTSRDDAATIKTVGGFKWSRNLDAWYLPRGWREFTRRERANALATALGDRAVLDLGDAAKTTTADERADAHVARATELAAIHERRAERHEAESDAQYERSNAAVEGIPFGQPILVGHHSERRHRNAIDKSWTAMGKSVEASKAAELEEARAASSASEARAYDQPARIGRRLVTNRAELGRWTRALAANHTRWRYENDWTVRARAQIAELTDTIARDERVLAEAGPVHSQATVQAGDLVRIRGHWLSVDKANPTKIRVTSFGLTLDYLYAEVQAHRRPTPDELTAMLQARETSDLVGTLRSPRLAPELRAAIEAVLAARA